MSFFGDVGHFLGKAFGTSKTDTSSLNPDQQRALDAYNQLMNERNQASTTYQDVTGQTVAAPTVDQSQIAGARANQQGYINTLQDAANGTAPSAAAAAYRGRQQDIAQQQIGLAGQARGTAGVAARRDAITAIGDQMQRANADTTAQQAAEQATARGQLGSAISDQRTAEQNLALQEAQNQLQAGTTTAQLEQEALERNQGAGLEAQQITNQNKQAIANEALSQSGAATGVDEAKIGVNQSDAQRAQGGLGMLLSGAATVGAAAAGKPPTSDERAKTDIKPDSQQDVDSFLGALKEVSYRYKPGKGPAGSRHGILAQDLEKSKIGRSLVSTGPDGLKRVDTDGLVLALAGVVARMNRRKGRR